MNERMNELVVLLNRYATEYYTSDNPLVSDSEFLHLIILSMNIKTLLIRSASGLVYIILVIGAILLRGIYFKIIFGLLAILTVYEFHTLTNKQENINALPILRAICATVAFAVVSYYKQPSWLYIGVFLMCFILMCLIICAVIEMFRKTPNPINNVAYTIFGQIYIVLPFSYSDRKSVV